MLNKGYNLFLFWLKILSHMMTSVSCLEKNLHNFIVDVLCHEEIEKGLVITITCLNNLFNDSGVIFDQKLWIGYFHMGPFLDSVNRVTDCCHGRVVYNAQHSFSLPEHYQRPLTHSTGQGSSDGFVPNLSLHLRFFLHLH